MTPSKPYLILIVLFAIIACKKESNNNPLKESSIFGIYQGPFVLRSSGVSCCDSLGNWYSYINYDTSYIDVEINPQGDSMLRVSIGNTSRNWQDIWFYRDSVGQGLVSEWNFGNNPYAYHQMDFVDDSLIYQGGLFTSQSSSETIYFKGRKKP